MKSAWRVDLSAGTALHEATGLLLRAKPQHDEGLDLAVAQPAPAGLGKSDANDLARLAREGGEAFQEALREERRRWLVAAGEALFGERWQVELARALDLDPRLIRRYVSGERWPSRQAILAARRLLRERALAIRGQIDGAARCWVAD